MHTVIHMWWTIYSMEIHPNSLVSGGPGPKCKRKSTQGYTFLFIFVSLWKISAVLQWAKRKKDSFIFHFRLTQHWTVMLNTELNKNPSLFQSHLSSTRSPQAGTLSQDPWGTRHGAPSRGCCSVTGPTHAEKLLQFLEGMESSMSQGHKSSPVNGNFTYRILDHKFS